MEVVQEAILLLYAVLKTPLIIEIDRYIKVPTCAQGSVLRQASRYDHGAREGAAEPSNALPDQEGGQWAQRCQRLRQQAGALPSTIHRRFMNLGLGTNISSSFGEIW